MKKVLLSGIIAGTIVMGVGMATGSGGQAETNKEEIATTTETTTESFTLDSKEHGDYLLSSSDPDKGNIQGGYVIGMEEVFKHDIDAKPGDVVKVTYNQEGEIVEMKAK